MDEIVDNLLQIENMKKFILDNTIYRKNNYHQLSWYKKVQKNYEFFLRNKKFALPTCCFEKVYVNRLVTYFGAKWQKWGNIEDSDGC